MLYDVFICHASEDKDAFVRPLADKLKNSHLEVWYDEFSLSVGDSLRESIDKGLAKSRFGIVVLSPAFFEKSWAKRELNGLTSREMNSSDSLILPIWHNVNLDQVLDFSPPLADKKAIVSNEGIDFVCFELLKKLRPDESPLLVARDELIHFGLNPPVVTDEYWLDVVEASNRIPCWGFVPPPGVDWGRWTFPLPNFQSKGEYRGVRLAWTAMQMQWEKEAERIPITQITPPEIVQEFIRTQPGLREICHKYPNLLAEYAPQLTIVGYGGEFEEDFKQLLEDSERKRREQKDTISGTGLTINKEVPKCDQNIALRHPTFGDYESDIVASQFVSGDLGGPHVKYYRTFDYLVWLLSSDSEWLPTPIWETLIEGIKKWNTWLPNDSMEEFSAPFIQSIARAKTYKTFQFGKKTQASLKQIIEQAARNMALIGDVDEVYNKFIAQGFIQEYFKRSKRAR
ncbi:MAG: toll/interleukin-1 receptor domain-containing protein [bacterium]|nr:toll/interleukin-1 receptor domain-containing protein [bacterium]